VKTNEHIYTISIEDKKISDFLGLNKSKPRISGKNNDTLLASFL
jgi:hypothetical protein